MCLSSITFLQHYKNGPSHFHGGHIHFVWTAMLCSGWNYLDELFVETFWRKIEVGICYARYNCYNHMWVTIIITEIGDTLLTRIVGAFFCSCVGDHGATISVIHFISWRNVSIDVGHYISGDHGNLCTLAGQIGPIQYCCHTQYNINYHWLHRIDIRYEQKCWWHHQKFSGAGSSYRKCYSCRKEYYQHHQCERTTLMQINKQTKNPI